MFFQMQEKYKWDTEAFEGAYKEKVLKMSDALNQISLSILNVKTAISWNNKPFIS